MAISGILTNNSISNNEYCVLKKRNVTVITSNKPYGANDGSNPFFNNRTSPKFNLLKNGVHSGHVQTGLTDPFCLVEGQKGKCKVYDGYFLFYAINSCLVKGQKGKCKVYYDYFVSSLSSSG